MRTILAILEHRQMAYHCRLSARFRANIDPDDPIAEERLDEALAHRAEAWRLFRTMMPNWRDFMSLWLFTVFFFGGEAALESFAAWMGGFVVASLALTYALDYAMRRGSV